jgi:hypothetical protein
MRRLFDTFAKLSDGKHIRVMGSAVPAGAWEYMSVCNVGGDDNMFDPVGNRWGIEGKDIRNAFNNSYFPSTFGIQGYHSDWSLYDAENLEAKSIGWGAGYMLGLSQDAVENSGEKDAIFTAFRAWEDARDSGAFDAGVKRSLQDLGLKFHLERRSPSSFRLHPVKEVRCSVAGGQEVDVENAYGSQRAQFALRFNAAAESAEVSVGGGLILACPHRIEAGQLLICKGDKLYLADKNRRKIEDLPVQGAVRFPKGRFSLAVKLAGAGAKADLTVWLLGPGRELRSRYQGMSEPSQQ